MKRLESTQTSFEIRPTEPTMVGRRTVAILALSEIIPIFDIAPSPPGDGEDDVIAELSELLHRW